MFELSLVDALMLNILLHLQVCPICSAEVSASEEREGTSENARG